MEIWYWERSQPTPTRLRRTVVKTLTLTLLSAQWRLRSNRSWFRIISKEQLLWKARTPPLNMAIAQWLGLRSRRWSIPRGTASRETQYNLAIITPTRRSSNPTPQSPKAVARGLSSQSSLSLWAWWRIECSVWRTRRTQLWWRRWRNICSLKS